MVEKDDSPISGQVRPPPGEPTQHYHDWPNDMGFESGFQQHDLVELEVIGSIPAYAAGTLFRTGPGKHSTTTDSGKVFSVSHWFDGFTTVHRFQINRPSSSEGSVTVAYNSRCTVDKLIEEVRTTGRFKDFSFAQKRDPCQSFFKKILSIFTPAPSSDVVQPDSKNVGVALTPNMPGIHASNDQGPTAAGSHSSGLRTLITRTDNANYQQLDPETLEPIGVCNQATLHQDLKGPLSATHAKTDPRTGDVYNYNLAFGPRGAMYRIWHACAATGRINVLATFSGPPAYMHSLFLTEHAVVLCVWNSRYGLGGASLLHHKNVLDAISPLDPTEPAVWYVVDRSPAHRGVLATYHTPAFFCFHTINAYEEASPDKPNEIDIVADLIAYDDLSVLHRFYYENLVSSSPKVGDFLSRNPKCRGYYARYRLPSVPLAADNALPQVAAASIPATKPRAGAREATAPWQTTVELPTIHPALATRKHRFVYGTLDAGHSSFFDGLGKLDTVTLETKTWSVFGHTAGEPIFVPRPGAAAEDDGVLLSVVLDGTAGESYLLCLDTRTMEELGTAKVGGVIAFGFHGLHVSAHPDGRNSGGQ